LKDRLIIILDLEKVLAEEDLVKLGKIRLKHSESHSTFRPRNR